ncbi:MAG TPA: copper resistance CopC family protein [Steroidobacteraceae bacterium]|nr:copper resistance CopC family protein [Steroidobacteraceae bacterium]
MLSLRALSLCCALALLPGVTQAHAHLLHAVPADGAVLRAAPARVVLTFSEPARLAVLWVAPENGARRRIASLPVEAAPEISVPLPPLSPGRYTLTWRVIGSDGHVVPGELRFTVSE